MVKDTLLFMLVISLLFAINPVKGQSLAVDDLKVEYVKNPIGVDVRKPRFSWVIKSSGRDVHQTGYHILVASSLEDLNENNGNVWDSGKVEGDESVNIPFNGRLLSNTTTYYWKVRVWNDEKEQAWSNPAKFHTGLFNKSDWEAQWIGASDTAISAPQLRKDFSVEKTIREAHAYIVGLGYYELYLNGQKVGDHVLDPGTTNYNERALYVTYDVTNYLNNGGNAVGVWLGNGFFRHRTTKEYGDRPQLLMELHIQYEDGTETKVISDNTWQAGSSPIQENSIYDGEVYDARAENKGWNEPGYENEEWSNATMLEVPESRKLSAQLMPPMRVTKTLKPVSMSEPKEGVYVFDFGQNMTGWPRLKVKGGEDNRVVMKTGEVTRSDMLRMKNEDPSTVEVDTIDPSPNRSAKARDVYILKGSSETEVYEPRFTYHGYRYVQLEGFPGEPDLSTLEARVVHSDVPKTGSFHASKPLLNQIHENILWGQLSNLVSMPTDCPQRDERQGWMGDAHLTAIEAMYNFDMAAFYTKWLQDIQDDQNEDGSVPDVVPNHKYSDVGTPAWQVAYPLITWYMYEHYNDERIIERHYNSLKEWMVYMDSLAEDHIVTAGRGDWVPPRLAYSPRDNSVGITSTGYYYQSAQILADMAEILGNQEDQEHFANLAEDIKEAFNQRFWNPEAMQYGTGSQTSNAFPLYLGVVPENEEQAFADQFAQNIRINDDAHVQTGILGTKALVESLPKHGHSELLYEMATQTTFPGWGYMIAKGATTLWERWGGYRYFDADMNSLNHIMFGSIDEFFYKNLGGIQAATPGFKEIIIEPMPAGDLNSASSSTTTMYGKVKSKWEKYKNAFDLDVIIPHNTSANIKIPKSGNDGEVIIKEGGTLIWENGQYVPGVKGINAVEEAQNYFIVSTGSGKFSFNLVAQ